MTIYSDNAGNHFLGDCIWANHNIAYSSVNFLKAHPHNSISDELSSLVTLSGNTLTFVSPQSSFDSFSAMDVVRGAFSSDLFGAFPRWKICISYYNNIGNSGFSFRDGVNILNGTTDGSTYTNSVFWQPHSQTPNSTAVAGINLSTPNNPIDNPQWFGCMDANSLALGVIRFNTSGVQVGGCFYYIGILDDLNTNFDYYSSNPYSKYFLFTSSFSSALFPDTRGAHRDPVPTVKSVLTTGDAQYPIVCSDGQSPTAQWATDFYVFDDDATLGYPAIGRVRNLLLAQGTYTIGKPVKIQGTVQPDNGFNCWLPVGTFGGKVVLMRCYSSV